VISASAITADRMRRPSVGRSDPAPVRPTH
jgi:hypothetical protein